MRLDFIWARVMREAAIGTSQFRQTTQIALSI